MQLFKINSNVLQNTLLEEHTVFQKSLETNNEVKEDTTSYQDGNILFSIPQNSKAFSDLITTDWNISTDSNSVNSFNYEAGSVWLNDVTTKIIKSSNTYNFNEAIQQVFEIVELLGDKLAGVLLVAGKIIINPLHPLAALVLIDERHNLQHLNFKIVTYLYNDRNTLESYFHSDKADIEKINKNILSLITLYGNKQEINRVLDTVKTEPVSETPLGDIRRFYKHSISDENDYEGDFVVIPVQLITKGIVAPYYGSTIVVREDTTAKGLFVTPFQSANMSSTVAKEKNSVPKFDSICTGSTPKTTIEGLRTLNHANLSSPLNTYCVGTGAILYADACIKHSINIYRLGGFINELITEKSTKDDTGYSNVSQETEIDAIAETIVNQETNEPDEADRGEAELAEQDLNEEIQTITTQINTTDIRRN